MFTTPQANFLKKISIKCWVYPLRMRHYHQCASQNCIILDFSPLSMVHCKYYIYLDAFFVGIPISIQLKTILRTSNMCSNNSSSIVPMDNGHSQSEFFSIQTSISLYELRVNHTLKCQTNFPFFSSECATYRQPAAISIHPLLSLLLCVVRSDILMRPFHGNFDN